MKGGVNVSENKERITVHYDLPYGWSVELPDKVELLQNKEGKIAVLLKSKNFGDVSTLVFEVSKDGVGVHSIPHFVEHVSSTLDKEIQVEINPFIYQQDD